MDVKFGKMFTYKKYNARSLPILRCCINTPKLKTTGLEKGKYDGYTLPLVLTEDLIEIFKDITEQINHEIEEYGYDNITIVYGNKIYPKVENAIAEDAKIGELVKVIISIRSVYMKDRASVQMYVKDIE